MALQFSCSCGHLLQVGDDLAGKRVRCPACRAVVTAPSGEPAVPDAVLVDAAARPEPVAAAPAPATCERGDAKCCGGAAVGGFVISMGSLVFGLVSLTAPFTWPVLGLLGTAVSSKGLRRIREGRAPAHGAGLARAGMAIGIGQVVLAALFWAGLFVVCAGGSCGERRGCGMKARARESDRALVDFRLRPNPGCSDAKKIEDCRLGDVKSETTAPEGMEWCEPCPECPEGGWVKKAPEAETLEPIEGSPDETK